VISFTCSLRDWTLLKFEVVFSFDKFVDDVLEMFLVGVKFVVSLSWSKGVSSIELHLAKDGVSSKTSLQSKNSSSWKMMILLFVYFPLYTNTRPDRKSCTPFCDFTNRCRIDGLKSHNSYRFKPYKFHRFILFLYFSKNALIKICRLFPNYTVNYRNPYCTKYGHFFWSGTPI